MAYRDVIDVILPTRDGRSAHITGHYGEVRAKGPHGGSDFNYVGGQAGINLTHPSVHSPVSGEVVFVGGQYGTVTIRDADGNEHKILHMDTQTVRVHQRVEAGTQIGTMGGRGPGDRNRYAQHVHYQMKDRDGKAINPEAFWDSRDTVRSQAPVHGGGGGHQPLLRNGDSNAEVTKVQQTLSHLGYRSLDGSPLPANGRFGPNTHAAVEAFQREHGLHVDGVVGKETRRMLAATQANPYADKSHPHHALYAQALERVHAEEDWRGIAHGRHSERVSGALAAAAANAGLVRIDRVEFNRDGTHARAVQVHPHRDEPGLNRASAAVDLHHALTASLVHERQGPSQAGAHGQDRPHLQARSVRAAP